MIDTSRKAVEALIAKAAKLGDLCAPECQGRCIDCPADVVRSMSETLQALVDERGGK